ncbi:MAG: cation:proton antiporter [Bdellovibrionales bacterium]
MHQDHFALVLIELVLVIGLSLFGRVAADAFKQSAVLGELLVGVICANVVRLAGGSFAGVVHDLNIFGEFGVIILLLVVGLETNVRDMVRVGPQAIKVAGVGMAAPLLLGILCGYIMLPIGTFPTYLFIGATLCATSVGISARVFKDLKRLNSPEAQLVLGAAVIDDILGLIVLTVCSGIASQGQFELMPLIKTILITGVFLGVIVWFGEALARVVVQNLEFLEAGKKRFLIPLATCFFLAWLAGEIGLATIVGAFAAGLILRDDQYAEPGTPIREQIAPLESLFAPVFFVLMGLQVDLSTFLHPSILLLALVLCVAAVAGKMACTLITDKKLDGVLVGIGMIPRGEVGLIFAGVGRTLDVLDDDLFAALVIMIIFTTLITPLALRWAVARNQEAELPPPPPMRS